MFWLAYFVWYCASVYAYVYCVYFQLLVSIYVYRSRNYFILVKRITNSNWIILLLLLLLLLFQPFESPLAFAETAPKFSVISDLFQLRPSFVFVKIVAKISSYSHSFHTFLYQYTQHTGIQNSKFTIHYSILCHSIRLGV